ncbi:MAG TPA: methyltransferase domain-containing protein [Cytophagales bacterium]|jgi:2-polyprenyl-3-methyl-5-hydroxy-6-metoxy-1,4-benzoquinol methylase
MNIYSEKKVEYFSNPRLDLISLLPEQKNSRILEIGAGGGDTLVKIKELGLAQEVVGVELFDMPHTNQQHPAIDRMLICNIETTELPLPKQYFDAILCGDVLEHLLDPWAVVHKLNGHLRPGGVLIASIPNFREFKNLYKVVIKGDFTYEEAGILDKTHLKFFCKRNVLQLMQTGPLRVTKVSTNLDYTPYTTKKHVFNKLTFGLFEEFLALQYIIVSTKS